MRIAKKPISSLTCILVVATVLASSTAHAKMNFPFFNKKNKHGAEPEQRQTPSETRAARATNKAAEEAIFETFASDLARFYSCQAEDTEWYLKRFFEQLKFSIATNPEIREITLKPSQITSMMKKHLKSNNPTSTKYLNELSEFSVEISEHLIEARAIKPTPDWNDRLGGGRGLLATTGLDSARKKWDTLFTKSLPSPLLRLRLCKEPLNAADRAAANEISVAKSTAHQSAEIAKPVPSVKVGPARPSQSQAPKPDKPSFFERRRIERAARAEEEEEDHAPKVTAPKASAPRESKPKTQHAEAPKLKFWQLKKKAEQSASQKPSVVAKARAPEPVVSRSPSAPSTRSSSAPSSGPVYEGAGATNSFLKIRISNLQSELKRAEAQRQTKVASEIRLQIKKLQEDLARTQ